MKNVDKLLQIKEELSQYDWTCMYELFLNIERQNLPRMHKNLKDRQLTKLTDLEVVDIARDFLSYYFLEDMSESIINESAFLKNTKNNVRDIFYLVNSVLFKEEEINTTTQFLMSDVMRGCIDSLLSNHLTGDTKVGLGETKVVLIDRYNNMNAWVETSIGVYDLKKWEDDTTLVSPDSLDYDTYRILLGELLGRRLANKIKNEGSIEDLHAFNQAYQESNIEEMMNLLQLPVILPGDIHTHDIQEELILEYSNNFSFKTPATRYSFLKRR